MAGTIKGIKVEVAFRGDTASLSKALGTVNSQIKSTQMNTNALTRLLKFDPTSAVLLTKKFDSMRQKVTLAKEKLLELNLAKEQMSKGNYSNEEWDNLNAEINKTQASLREAQEAVKQFGTVAGQQTQAVGQAMQAAGASITEVGQKLLPLSIAVAAVGAGALKSAIDFESSFTGVMKAANGSEEAFDDLAEASRRMALTKPIDVNDVNLIMELGAQLGIALEDLEDFSATIADLDVATNLDAETAAEQLARLANITGMTSDEYRNFGSAIVELGNNSATTETNIMDMAMRIAAAGTTTGMTEADILALSTAVSSVGIEAEMGGTAISRMLIQISKDVGNNTETLGVWAETAGMSAQEFATMWTNEPTKALQAFFHGLSSVEEQGSAVFSLLDDLGISQIRQTDTMMRLGLAADKLTDDVKMSNDAWSMNTALTREAERRYATTESQIQLLKNTVNNAAISFGNVLLPAIKNLLSGLTEAADGFGNFFTEMNEGVESGNVWASMLSSVAATMAIGAAAAAPLALVIGKLTSGVGKAVVAYGKFQSAVEISSAAISLNTGVKEKNVIATNLSALAEARRTVKGQVAAAVELAQAAATGAKTAALERDVALGVVSTAGHVARAAAIGAENLVVGIATRAQILWNAAMSANPIGAILTLLAVGVTLYSALSAAIGSATDLTKQNTAATNEQQAAVDRAQAAYDEAVAAQGEHSDAALKAKDALDREQQTLNDSKQTIGQFCEELDAAKTAHDEFITSFDDAIAKSDAQAGAVMNLGDQLLGLVDAEGNAVGSTEELQVVVDALNENCQDLNLSFDEQTNKLNMNADAIKSVMDAQADSIRAEAALEEYSKAIQQQVTDTDDLTRAREELAAQGIIVGDQTKEQLIESRQYTDEYGGSITLLNEAQLKLVDGYYATKDSLDQTNRAVAESQQRYQDFAVRQEKLSFASGKVAEAMKEGSDVTEVANQVRSEYNELLGESITAEDIAAQYQADLAAKEAQRSSAIDDTRAALQGYIDTNAAVGKALEDSGYSVEEFATKLVDSGGSMDDFSDKTQNLASKTQDAFNKIEMKSDLSLDSMLETLEANAEATRNWGDGLSQLYGKAANDSERAFIDNLATLGPEYYPIIEQLNGDSGDALHNLAMAYENGGKEAVDAILDEMHLGKDKAVDASGEIATDSGEAFNENLLSELDKCPPEVQKYVEELEQKAGVSREKMAQAGSESGAGFKGSLLEQISQCPDEVQQYIKQLEDKLTASGIEFDKAGSDSGAGFREGFVGEVAKAPEDVGAKVNEIQSKLEASADPAGIAGKNAGANYEGGLVGGVAKAPSKIEYPLVALDDRFSIFENAAGAHGTTAGTKFGSSMGSGMNSTNTLIYNTATAIQKSAQNGVSGMGKAGATGGISFGAGAQSGINSYTGGVGNAAGSLQSAASGRVGNMGTIGLGAGSALGGMMAGGINGSRGGVSSAASGIADAAKNAKNYGNPYSWGSDLGSQMASGITSMLGRVTDAAGSLATAISSHLHFSVPDVGALSDFDTYMPDMIDLMVYGMKQGEGRVNAAANSLAQSVSNGINGMDVNSFESGLGSTFGITQNGTLQVMQETSRDTATRLDSVIEAVNSLAEKIDPNYTVVLDTGVLAGSMTKKIDKNLGDLQRRREAF